MIVCFCESAIFGVFLWRLHFRSIDHSKASPSKRSSVLPSMLNFHELSVVERRAAGNSREIIEARHKESGELYRITVDKAEIAGPEAMMPDEAAPRQSALSGSSAIQMTPAWYENLLEGIREVLVVYDKQLRIVFVSSSVTSILGYRADELVGQAVNTLMPEADQTQLRELLKSKADVTEEPRWLASQAIRHHDGRLLKLDLRNLNLRGIHSIADYGACAIAPEFGEGSLAAEGGQSAKVCRQELKARTQTLRQRDHELRDSQQLLATAREQLINFEKLASLGQLTAGIAHEINNPINFVSSNIGPLQADFAELRSLLDAYIRLEDSPDKEAALRELRAMRADIDLDYLLEEIASLLAGIEEGAVRTKEIVAGLRMFSRREEQGVQPAQIHEGLDSTLLLLHNKLKHRIEVHRDYGSLPPIPCNAGKLNQVFMNLLSNAAQAIEGKGSIFITTRHVGDSIRISIRDTGKGIPEEIQPHVFESFFTTKPAGEGTGLGLSISKNIVEKHRGRLSFTSAAGEGSEFIITLPIHLCEE